MPAASGWFKHPPRQLLLLHNSGNIASPSKQPSSPCSPGPIAPAATQERALHSLVSRHKASAWLSLSVIQHIPTHQLGFLTCQILWEVTWCPLRNIHPCFRHSTHPFLVKVSPCLQFHSKISPQSHCPYASPFLLQIFTLVFPCSIYNTPTLSSKHTQAVHLVLVLPLPSARQQRIVRLLQAICQ